MSPTTVRVLLVADTHLGFDLPFRPRIVRRRRGPDFFTNFERALQPALRGDVDLVVHGGDLFYRSRIPQALVEMAMAPLLQVAKIGVPVFVIPGNHERSRIPLQLWTVHPNIHIFDQPRTFCCTVANMRIALSGFPFHRRARDVFPELVSGTRYEEVAADVRLLCVHQAVEGAQVGIQNYTFRSGLDVVCGSDIPGDFAAVLCGHIHRSQVLTHDLSRRPLGAPVVYPGAVERTSFAERDEEKHYVIAEFAACGDGKGQLLHLSFVPLPTRPMVHLTVETEHFGAESLTRHLRSQLSSLDPESVVRIQVRGRVSRETSKVLSAAHVRSLAPDSMNVSVSYHRTVRFVD